MNQPCNYTTTGGVQDAQESQACQPCQQLCPPPPSASVPASVPRTRALSALSPVSASLPAVPAR